MKPSADKGFTLLELVAYVGITALILTAVSAFLFVVLQTRVKNQAITEVEEQGIYVMQIIGQTLRNAEGVNSPAIGGSTNSLSVNVVEAGDDPTIFSLSGSTIQIQEGAGSPLELTNERVVASGLNFTNLSRIDTPGLIRIKFTLSHINPENRQEFEHSKDFTASFSVRDE